MRVLLCLVLALTLAPDALAGGGFGGLRTRQRSVVRQRGQFRAAPAVSFQASSYGYAQPALLQQQVVQQYAVQPVQVQYQIRQQLVQPVQVQYQQPLLLQQQDYCAPPVQFQLRQSLTGGCY